MRLFIECKWENKQSPTLCYFEFISSNFFFTNSVKTAVFEVPFYGKTLDVRLFASRGRRNRFSPGGPCS